MLTGPTDVGPADGQPPAARADAPIPRAVKLAVVACTLGVVVLVGMSLRRPEPPWFVPSPAAPRPAVVELVGPELITVDARDELHWRFFSFARGSVVDRPDADDWDLAFRRFQIIANGGAGFAGQAGIVDLGDVSFDATSAVPSTGYVATVAGGDSTNAAIGRWYDYSFTSHLLSPKSRVYAVRTADGRYAKIEFVGYYCPGATPGCITFRYMYQGAGGASFEAASDAGSR
ncbi:MAG TPA: HmuY family protein [Longimicrobiales bacterium]|nr:HmuY family protein [Longimicrobiales bacterium]